MSMTNASAQYFERVAPEWDSLRSGYFSNEVAQAAIRKAYLRTEMVVADVGAGTGFLTASLAPLVRRVYVLDGSPAMLEVARKNLHSFDNLVFQEADGLSLPLPDESLDVVFANMYLHHIVDPLATIREMVRVLRPGGRLVITDMDTHPYGWLKDEMADVWQGFEREQIRAWYSEAGLVNIIVDSTGESCNAESQVVETTDPAGRRAQISIFVAAGSRPIEGVKEAIQEGYGATARGQSSCCSSTSSEGGASSSCCSPSQSSDALVASSCCGGSSSELITIDDNLDVKFVAGYTPDERAQVPAETAEISLGCGNPLAIASLHPGETVLDIGSGGGIDAFLSLRQVGPTGHVIGVDMTPEMLVRARRSAEKAGLEGVEFRQGQAEDLPVGSSTVDVAISNCVINLCEDKGKVFGEVFRVLKPGGRLAVSDMVTDKPFSLDLLQNPADWPGCVFGALTEQEYIDLIAQAGFKDIHVARSQSAGFAEDVRVYSIAVSAHKSAD